MSIASTSAEFEAHFHHSPAQAADENELARWRELCRELIEQREHLRQELVEVKAERDQLRKALIAPFAAKEINFTKEEVMASLDARPTIDEVIDELDRAEQ